jgi:hypothetical protein
VRRKFRYEFEYDDNKDDICILRDTTSSIDFCIDKQKRCKGKLEDRPVFCPLVEVKDDKEI